MAHHQKVHPLLPSQSTISRIPDGRSARVTYHRVAALHEHRGRLLRPVLYQGEKGSQTPKGKGVRRHIRMFVYQSRSYRISERPDNRRIPCHSTPVYLSERTECDNPLGQRH